MYVVGWLAWRCAPRRFQYYCFTLNQTQKRLEIVNKQPTTCVTDTAVVRYIDYVNSAIRIFKEKENATKTGGKSKKESNKQSAAVLCTLCEQCHTQQ